MKRKRARFLYTLNNESYSVKEDDVIMPLNGTEEKPLYLKEKEIEEMQKVNIIKKEFDLKKKEVDAGIERLKYIVNLFQNLLDKYEKHPELIQKKDNEEVFLNLELMNTIYKTKYIISNNESASSFDNYVDTIEDVVTRIMDDFDIVRSELLTLTKTVTESFKSMNISNCFKAVQQETTLSTNRLNKLPANAMEVTEQLLKFSTQALVGTTGEIEQDFENIKNSFDKILSDTNKDMMIAILSKDALVEDNVKDKVINAEDLAAIRNKIVTYLIRANQTVKKLKGLNKYTGTIGEKYFKLIKDDTLFIPSYLPVYQRLLEETRVHLEKPFNYSVLTSEERKPKLISSITEFVNNCNNSLKAISEGVNNDGNTTEGAESNNILIDHRDVLKIMSLYNTFNFTNENFIGYLNDIYKFLNKGKFELEDTDVFYTVILVLSNIKYLLEVYQKNVLSNLEDMKELSTLIKGYIDIADVIKGIGEKL